MTLTHIVSPTPLDATAIVVDENAPHVKIATSYNPVGIDYTTSPETAGKDYTINVLMITEAGTQKTATSEKLTFTITISDPCIDDSIILGAGTVPTSAEVYTAGDTAHTF